MDDKIRQVQWYQSRPVGSISADAIDEYKVCAGLVIT